MQPYEMLYCFVWRSEGDWGERREAGIQWIQPPKAVIDPEFRQTTSGAHGSAGRADCLPRGKPPVRPQAHTPAPVGPDAPTPAREQGLQPYGALYCFGWRSEGGAGGRAESPPACSAERNLCRGSSPLVGPDAPTPARGQGLQPYGALTLFFRWRKKSVQKKASGTATPGKSPLLPILTAGLAMSRAS